VGGAVNRSSPQTKSHSPEKFIAELLECLLELFHVLTRLFAMLLEANFSFSSMLPRATSAALHQRVLGIGHIAQVH